MLENFFWRMVLLVTLVVTHSTVWAQQSAADALSEAITTGAVEQRSRLNFDGTTFTGPAWGKLLSEGKAAQFFLLGEEHGIAEIPKLAAALYRELANVGYERFIIETSPTMATKLDLTVRASGLDGLRQLYAEPGGEPAFFGMKEEAEMLAAIRQTSTQPEPIFWGVDYEVLSDRQLIQALETMPKPPAAETALAELAAASDLAWAKHRDTGDPGYIFSFSGDGNLVRAVRAAWPARDVVATRILATLEETLEINSLFVRGQNWRSNDRRATLIRQNFLRHWRAETSQGRMPKLMAKMGASHLIRGRSNSEAFDLGVLLHELADILGGHAVSLLVLPGEGAMTAIFDPSKFTFSPGPAKDDYANGLEPLTAATYQDGFTLIDLRPLRAIKGLSRPTSNPSLLRTIMGYDMVLVMSGSTPSGTFAK